MARLIDADRLKQYFDIVGVNDYGCSFATIDSQPTVDAEPVRHGKWERVTEKSLYITDEHTTIEITSESCSVCKCRINFKGAKPYINDKYCPNCGAKMQGEIENE